MLSCVQIPPSRLQCALTVLIVYRHLQVRDCPVSLSAWPGSESPCHARGIESPAFYVRDQ